MKILGVIALCGLAYSVVIPGPITSAATVATIEATPSSMSINTVQPSASSTKKTGTGTSTSTDSSTPTRTQSQPTTTNSRALENWQRINDITRQIWNKSNHENETVRYIRKGQAHNLTSSEAAVKPREDPAYGDWTAQGFCSSSWGWWLVWYQPGCWNDQYWDYETGHIMKSVVTESWRTTFKYWGNETEKWFPSEENNGVCRRGWGWRSQCQNAVWNKWTASWEWMSGMNSNLGWSYGNSSYNYHDVRTIWDCNLQQVAIQYNTVVYEFGTNPIQYIMDGSIYYRFYDDNNFAWFVACPPQWNLKKRNANEKRQGIRGRNSNPVWDFGTWYQRDEYSDMTWYPESLIEDFDEDTSYTAMYWPEADEQILEVEGLTCQQMAVSRPGLRHWTAKMVNIPPETYPSITNERHYGYPDWAWYGWDAWAWSWQDNAWLWWDQ